MMPQRRSSSGFTLLEILVAVAIFAIFSAMAYGGLTQLLSNRERIDAERVFWREFSLAFYRMEQDFLYARNRPIRNLSGGLQIPFEGKGTMFRLASDPRNVEFTRGGVELPNGTDLQRVGYAFEGDKVLRETWAVLDRGPASEPVRTALLENVSEFTITFYHQGEWIPQWPPIGQQAGLNVPLLPRAVQVTVTLKDRGEFKRTFLVGEG